jgi:hypothetical protein
MSSCRRVPATWQGWRLWAAAHLAEAGGGHRGQQVPLQPCGGQGTAHHGEPTQGEEGMPGPEDRQGGEDGQRALVGRLEKGGGCDGWGRATWKSFGLKKRSSCWR